MREADWRSVDDLVIARERILARVVTWRDMLMRGELAELKRALHPDEVIASLDGLVVPAKLVSLLLRGSSAAYVSLEMRDEPRVLAAIDRIRDAWYLEMP